ncbi:hypothetical protein [Piscinibacter sp. HJYY11]|uniref:hypothetical protein n=1 Tax=Piscinibacter sp. HJYY11 TaxID=2801333 RepID=UPI00191EC32C|nr:hypothetical protein [Piscinibacter sp. HJYY11]MBL0726520.1 hypothetical protein [Piscinibacter sp. HJYY11]
MKFWKAGLGVGAACAACCAIPLLGMAGVAGGLAAFGAALWACIAELGLVVLALGAVGVGVLIAWRRRQARRCAPRATSCDCSSSCSTAKIGA